MLHGMESWRRKESGETVTDPEPPTVAALLAGFGACGYLLTTRAALACPLCLRFQHSRGSGSHRNDFTHGALGSSRQRVHIAMGEDDIHGQVAVVSRTITR